MKLFELFATLGLDTADFDAKLDGAYRTLVDVSRRAEDACQWTLRLFEMPSAAEAVSRIERWWSGVRGSVSLTLPSPELRSVSTGRAQGFATGLDYVPYNEFPAMLHEGEAVLTKAEAEDWRRDAGRAETAGPPAQPARQEAGAVIAAQLAAWPARREAGAAAVTGTVIRPPAQPFQRAERPAAIDAAGIGEAVARAVKDALDGVVVSIDGQAAGKLLAEPVSRGIAEMAYAGRFVK